MIRNMAMANISSMKNLYTKDITSWIKKRVMEYNITKMGFTMECGRTEKEKGKEP